MQGILDRLKPEIKKDRPIKVYPFTYTSFDYVHFKMSKEELYINKELAFLQTLEFTVLVGAARFELTASTTPR